MEQNYSIPIKPAPWTLKGRGYILLYHFPKSFSSRKKDIPSILKAYKIGRFGAAMLVNYESSDAGPYDELLFIPGRIHMRNEKPYTISNIFVSTEASVVNGRRNWGIPKVKAEFEWRSFEEVSVSSSSKAFLKAIFKAFGPSFPITTKLLPFPMLQLWEGKEYRFKFSGKGKAKLCKVKNIQVDSVHFPDLSCIKPLLAVQISPFEIIFPTAKLNVN